MPTKFINELNFDKKGYDSFDRNPAVIGYVNDVADYAVALIAANPGPTGAQGVQGIAGVPGPVGPAGLTWRSTFVPGTSYILNDAVGYNGASYYCILATSSATVPSSNTTNWALLASQGAIGSTGAQGPTGPAGSNNTLSIGTVSTLAAGASATASISGSSPSQVLNLGIPQGVSGSGGGASYLIYSAKISQSGSAAPTLVTKTDTMGGGGVWYRFNPGYYYLAGNATLSGLTNARVMVFFTKDYLTYGVVTASFDSGAIYINTYNASGVLTDSLMNGSSIEIRVYPS